MSENIKLRLRSRLRIVLLGLQILIPFGLHLAMRAGNHPLAVGTAAILGMSMLVMVWLG